MKIVDDHIITHPTGKCKVGEPVLQLSL